MKFILKVFVKKFLWFVFCNNNNSGKSFVFSFKMNKKFKKKILKVISV